MYKTHNWTQKQQKTQALQQIYVKLCQYVHLYKMRTDLIQEKGVKADVVRIRQTLEHYHENHLDIPLELLNLTKPFFEKIRKYDTPIRVDNKPLLFHTYILTMHIVNYLHLFKYYIDGSFKKNTFAYLKGDKKRYIKKSNEHEKRASEPLAITSGADDLMSFIFKNLAENNEVAEAFINQCTLFPIHQIKDLDKEYGDVNTIKSIIKKFSSTNISSMRPIYKSLVIILVGYLTLKMKIPKKDAIQAVQILLDDLADESDDRYQIDVSANNLLSNVYIYGRLDGMPIFASNDKENYSEEVFDALKQFHIEADAELNIDMRSFDYRTYSPYNDLPSVYLLLTPMELLQPYT